MPLRPWGLKWCCARWTNVFRLPKQTPLADALVTLSPGVNCFPVVQRNVDEMFAVDDGFTLKAMKILLTEGK